MNKITLPKAFKRERVALIFLPQNLKNEGCMLSKFNLIRQ